MLSIPRIAAPTPWLLHPALYPKESLRLPFIAEAKGITSPLFPKGRACIAWILSVLKKQFPGRTRVVMPAYGARSIAFAALEQQLEVALVDISRESFFPSRTALEAIIDSSTLCVVLPYNWGMAPTPQELSDVFSLLEAKGIFWIDDFATTLPDSALCDAVINRSPCLFYSFGKTKLFTIMDGGAAFFPESHSVHKLFTGESATSTSDTAIPADDLMRMLTNFLYKLYISPLGYRLLSELGLTARERPPTSLTFPTRPLSEQWCGALHYIFKQYYNATNQARRTIFDYYISSLNNDPRFFVAPSLSAHCGSRFPLLCVGKKLRDAAYQALNRHAIGASLGYIEWLGEVNLLQPYLEKYRPTDFPVALSYQDELLTLPAHHLMDEEGVEKICSILKAL